MWELGNRGVIVLISVLTGCALIYNAWGPILALAVSLFLVIYACYSLAINDSLLSPHAFLAFDYLKDAAAELKLTLDAVVIYVREHVSRVRDNLLGRYRQRFSRMDGRRRSNYQLSTDPLPRRSSPIGRNSTANVSGGSSRFSLLDQLSPIPRNLYKEFEDENQLYKGSNFSSESQERFGKITSTPVIQHRCDSRNGDLGRYSMEKSTPRKNSPMYSQSHTLSRGDNETYFSPDGSPWGNSISPKLRPKAGGVKTVQTVAGPLLASTRYNIDPKVYSDVTSPGLTTRLTKYATEANGKLTHQAQYGTGQFPKVNLHAGPLPLLNKKTVKNRTPVTVRVAPPEVARYSPPERQRILSKLCQVEEKPPSVVEVLREISLKRHASREEVGSDLIKKQRTDVIFTDELSGMAEMNQKRSREESSKSEDDISPQNKTVRPTKRTKTPSCYDILNSLSSSINVASGVKRKAIDFSRSGTPDFEKHFKSLESVHTTETHVTPPTQNIISGQKQPLSREKHTREDVHTPPNRSQEVVPMKSILKVPGKQSLNARTEESVQRPCTQDKSMRVKGETAVTTAAPINVADKLFMRAERQVNEKLKSLVEEQGNIKAKFTGDDAEEIKKEDIVNMRQTSMRARLQSMFDAISGKAPSRINPDVVIQAEEISTPPSEVPTTCATLNSSTTTTNVNTMPISTSAIAPFGSPAEPSTRQTKHVAFNLPSMQSSDAPVLKTPEIQKSLANQTEVSKSQSLTSTQPQTVASTSSLGLNFPNANAGPALNFGKPSTSAPMLTSSILATSSAVPSFGVSAANINTTAATFPAMTTVSSNLSSFGSNPSTSATTAVLGFGVPKTQAPSFGSLTSGSGIVPSSITQSSSSLTPSISTPAPLFGSSQTGIVSVPAGVSTTSLPVSTAASTSSILSTATPASSAQTLFSFGNNVTTSQTTKSELFSFGVASTTTSTGAGFGPAATGVSIFNGTTATTTTSSGFMPQNFAAASSTSGFGTCTTASSSSLGVAQTTSIFSFGTSKPSVSESKPVFSFGAGAASIASTTSAISNTTSMFGNTNTTTAPSFSTSATSAPAFGTQANAAIGFGASTNSSTAFGTANMSAGTFGTPTSTTGFGTPVTSTGNFGVPATSTSTFGTLVTNATTFGTPATSTSTFGASAASTTSFGTPATSTSTFGTPATSTAAFGTPSTTTATPQFGGTASASLFGAPPTSTFGPSGQPIFGGTSTPGAIGTFNPPKTTSVSVFGSGPISAASKPVSTAPSLFSDTNTTAVTAPTATKSVFGSNTGMFGQAKSPTTFGATPAVFGAPSAPLFGSQTAAAPTFGASNPATTTMGPSFGTSSVPATTATLNFGATTSTSAPGFGSQTMAITTPAQNTSTAPTFGAPNSIFGSETSSAPIFGSVSSTSTSGGFGAVQSAFGGQNTGTIPFGTTNNPPAFGEERLSPFGVPTTSTPAFGAATTSTTAAPIFGTSGTATGGRMFSFGGGQKQPAQLNTSFTFGSTGTGSNNNNNTTSVAPTPFQFTGAQAKPAATGFNFTPPTSTPSMNFNTSGAPTFNAATPGMFSIGSGSTAPRSRNVRQRKPR